MAGVVVVLDVGVLALSIQLRWGMVWTIGLAIVLGMQVSATYTSVLLLLQYRKFVQLIATRP